MATIHDFQEAQKKHGTSGKKPRTVTFYSATFRKLINGVSSGCSASVSVNIEDGDAVGLIVAVMQNHGIWNDEGTVLIPWPCAYVDIEDWDGVVRGPSTTVTSRD